MAAEAAPAAAAASTDGVERSPGMKYRTPVLLLLLSLAAAAPATPKPVEYATAQDAVTALVDALRSGNTAQIEHVLGPGSSRLVVSGDPVVNANERQRFITAYDAKHTLVTGPGGQTVLQVGADDWPLPIPIVQGAGGWHFDAKQGAEDIVDRRIGRNEIAAIRTSLAYVDAQKAYFDLYRQYAGTGAYAQRLVSTPGNYDGLYWPQAPGIPESPLQPLVSAAEQEGYPGELVAGHPVPYQGYYFRILKAQGPDAPDGARDYVEHGKMTGGFALLAWPARYGASGIMTFQVGPGGTVFQKDLGPRTTERAGAITRFNPDLSWARVDISD